jgi:hypothetical protein
MGIGITASNHLNSNSTDFFRIIQYNNISIVSHKLEKILELINQLIKNSKNDKLTEKLSYFIYITKLYYDYKY